MCDNASFGCTVVVKLECLAVHREECEHNPKKPVPCEQGCGLVIPKDELRVRVYLFIYFFLFNPSSVIYNSYQEKVNFPILTFYAARFASHYMHVTGTQSLHVHANHYNFFF